MNKQKKLITVPMYGYASGIGAPNQGCASAPTFLLENINKLNSNVFLESHGMVESSNQTVGVDSLPEISSLCTALAEHCAKRGIMKKPIAITLSLFQVLDLNPADKYPHENE